MNTYLYARYWDGEVDIKKVVAKGYTECQDKIMQYYLNELDSLNDTDYSNFEEFCECLASCYDIIIGEIQEIDAFM